MAVLDKTRVVHSRSEIQIRGQAQKESILGGIIILPTPAPIIDPFPAWKPTLFYKDTAKGKKCPLQELLVP